MLKLVLVNFEFEMVIIITPLLVVYNLLQFRVVPIAKDEVLIYQCVEIVNFDLSFHVPIHENCV